MQTQVLEYTMIKRILISGLFVAACYTLDLNAHCQMPCGIYHDDMVFDQIDQYVETVVKGITVLEDSKFKTIRERNEFIRWVMEKEKSSNDVAELITTFFLQQKIKPGEEDTPERLASAHRLLFLLVKIKQNADLKVVYDFYQEWEKFKLMFHIEGYECKMEQIKLKKWAEKREKLRQQNGGKLPDEEEDHENHSDADDNHNGHDHGDGHFHYH